MTFMCILFGVSIIVVLFCLVIVTDKYRKTTQKIAIILCLLFVFCYSGHHWLYNHATKHFETYQKYWAVTGKTNKQTDGEWSVITEKECYVVPFDDDLCLSREVYDMRKYKIVKR